MSYIWDYRVSDLKKAKQGKRLLLERSINFGPGSKKINKSEVKKNWHKLNLFPNPKRLMELLIWGKKPS